MLEALAQCPDSFPSLEAKLLQVTTTILNNTAELPGLTEASIGLLNVLVKNSPVPLSEGLLAQGFPLVVKRIMNTEDSGIAQEGILCLSSYVRKAAPQIVAW